MSMQWLAQRRPTPVPDFAAEITQLASFAVGDQRAGLFLARAALQNKPRRGQAVAALYRLLPDTWLAWPSIGPRETLQLDLRTSDAERLISVLGEWSPSDRLLLGLYLLLDIPRDRLGTWLPHPEAGARVAELLIHVAHALDWIDTEVLPHACAAVTESLLEVDDPDLGRKVRLHLLGCPTCRAEATALRRARALVLKTINLFFPPQKIEIWAAVPLPANLQRQPPWHRRQGVLVTCLLLFAVGLYLGQRPPLQAQPFGTAAGAFAQLPAPSTAGAVIERALRRWEAAPHQQITHERYRARSGTRTVIIERWYDWMPPHRLRIKVDDVTGAPILDLVSDGRSRLSYTVHAGTFGTRTADVKNEAVAALTPILRNLPSVGPFGSFPADQRWFDQELLWAAQKGEPRLLGSTTFAGRATYRVVYTDHDGARIYLSIDRSNFAVLQATRTVPDAGRSEQVWQAEVFAAVPSLPVGSIARTQATTTLPNPRQIWAEPQANIAVSTIVGYSMPFALPEVLPGTPIAAFMRVLENRALDVLQLYEGPDWSLMVITPRIDYLRLRTRQLDQQTGPVAYAVMPSSDPDVVQVEWRLDSANHGMLFFWQAGKTRSEQLAALQPVLASLTSPDHTTADVWQQRFDSTNHK